MQSTSLDTRARTRSHHRSHRSADTEALVQHAVFFISGEREEFAVQKYRRHFRRSRLRIIRRLVRISRDHNFSVELCCHCVGTTVHSWKRTVYDDPALEAHVQPAIRVQSHEREFVSSSPSIEYFSGDDELAIRLHGYRASDVVGLFEIEHLVATISEARIHGTMLADPQQSDIAARGVLGIAYRTDDDCATIGLSHDRAR